MNFNLVKRESKKPLFWQYDEYNNFISSAKYTKITFDKFLNLMDEYYLIEYSCKLSRNGWLVFNWIKYMSKKDGFIYISYDEIVKVFCKEGTKISRPTFFKCISELETNELIVSINTKNQKYAEIKGCNIYGIIDKSYYIYEICDVIENNYSLSISDAIDYIKNKNKKVLFDISKECSVTNDDDNKKPKIKDDKKLKLLMMTTLKPIKKELKEFFGFLGSYNKTGSIAVSRKLKIALRLKEYLEGGFEYEDFIDAFNITMKNTVVGKNPYRERYMLKILENQCEDVDEEVDVNEVAIELSKKAEEKITAKYNNNKGTNVTVSKNTVDDTSYEIEKEKLLNNEGYYKNILNIFNKNVPSNKYEKQLHKIANAIKKKFDTYADNDYYLMQRVECMRKYDCYESVGYDNKWNRVISWVDADGNSISKKTAYKYFKEDKIDVVFTKYDIVKEE